MSAYTEAVVEEAAMDRAQVGRMRHVLFPAGRLHVAWQPESADRLGFTLCGRMIPKTALVNQEIPGRFRPELCERCGALLGHVFAVGEEWE